MGHPISCGSLASVSPATEGTDTVAAVRSGAIVSEEQQAQPAGQEPVPDPPGQPGPPDAPRETTMVAASDPATHRFECRSCGYVYDPAEGLAKLAIAAGTPFQDLDPASFRCPVCRSRMPAFRDIGPRSKPSGFEENLNFGFGVNRLTPGQKNVLIFGGFALAFAFFLSLYSLR
jgi:rubredoxin